MEIKTIIEVIQRNHEHHFRKADSTNHLEVYRRKYHGEIMTPIELPSSFDFNGPYLVVVPGKFELPNEANTHRLKASILVVGNACYDTMSTNQIAMALLEDIRGLYHKLVTEETEMRRYSNEEAVVCESYRDTGFQFDMKFPGHSQDYVGFGFTVTMSVREIPDR